MRRLLIHIIFIVCVVFPYQVNAGIYPKSGVCLLSYIDTLTPISRPVAQNLFNTLQNVTLRNECLQHQSSLPYSRQWVRENVNGVSLNYWVQLYYCAYGPPSNYSYGASIRQNGYRYFIQTRMPCEYLLNPTTPPTCDNEVQRAFNHCPTPAEPASCSVADRLSHLC